MATFRGLYIPFKVCYTVLMTKTNTTQTPEVGAHIRMRHDHLFETITFMVTVVKVTDTDIIFRVPTSITRIPFPPCGGKQFGKLPLAKFNPQTLVTR